ncbi:hypothetical protein [Floccifex sp.]|uniref:hypothetical protein n=1 Tax=Floccifex sp. TaxID=2815810 RepID=UPI003F0ABCF1
MGKEIFEITSKAMEQEQNKNYRRSQYLWESALIEIVEQKESDWAGFSLVVLTHIYEMMTNHFNFKAENSVDHLKHKHKYKPAGHWEDVINLDNKIKSLHSSTFSMILRLIVAIVLILLFFVFVSYPFSSLEIDFMVGVGLILCFGVAIVVGLSTNIIVGFISIFITFFIYDFLCQFVSNILHLADSDLGMLYICRFIVVIVSIFLIYSIFKSISNNKEASRLQIQMYREDINLKEHTQQIYKATCQICDEFTKEDLREVAAIQTKRAYIESDIYGFNLVNEKSNLEDSLYLLFEALVMKDYYKDMRD